jgi:hypothetical protein
VHGSVLVRENTVYAVAGRSMYLDGGVWLVRLDGATGELLGEVHHDHRIPNTQEDLMTKHGHLTMPVALPDILSSDGESLFMRSQEFDLDGQRKEILPLNPGFIKYDTVVIAAAQAGPGRHIFCPSGFLDDTWFHRAYWTFGRHFPGGTSGWRVVGDYTPAGRILAFDEDRVYGYARKNHGWRTPLAYHLYAAGQDLVKLSLPKEWTDPAEIERRRQAAKKKKGAPPDPKTHKIDLKWSTDVDVHARALLVAGDTLFLAGPPAVVDEVRAYENWGSPEGDRQLAAQAEAIAGKRGAKLVAVNKHDGTTLSETNLPAPPVFDGMIAAQDFLYLATVDGRIVCLGNVTFPERS